MFRGKIKTSEKLPRGTFLYITVGDRFYAGEQAVIEETKVANPEWGFPRFEKPTGERSWRWGCGLPTKIPREHVNYYKKRDGRAPPGYWLENGKQADPTKKAVVGRVPRLTDEFKDVKQFRRLNQAEVACDKLKAMYADLGIRVAIELHKGDK